MRRKTIAILLCFAVIAGLIPNKEVLNVTAKEKKVYSKSVVKANNYSDYEEIKTPEDMDKLNYVVDGKYCLSADIDMSEYEGTYKPAEGFRGVLDGRGHTIKNLHSVVFDSIVGSATVRDLKIKNSNIGSDDYGKGFLINTIDFAYDGLKGKILIENVDVEGKADVSKYQKGESGSFAGICSYVNIHKETQSVKINNCSVNIKMSTDTGNYAIYYGGIIGGTSDNSKSTLEISNCVSLGSIKSSDTDSMVGGIAGEADYVNTTNCYADMELEGNYVGGLVGYAENVMIENCMSQSYVNGSCVGGLVGCGDKVSQQYIISSVSLEEKIRGTQFAGTVIGKSYAMITIKNVFTYSKLYDELNRTYLTDKQGTALNSMQLTEQSAFPGLDFTDTFACVPGVNGGKILLKKLGKYFVTDSPTIEVKNVNENEKRIIMHSDASSAKIYYSNKDDEVTTSSTLYTVPFSIYGTTYFKLIAVADGYGASAPTEMTVKFQVSKPTVSIEQGNYKQALSIQLSCGTKGAVIYYTTDGSSPTTGSKKYTGTPIVFDSNGTYTINAIAVKSGWVSSEELVKTYNINLSEVSRPTNTPVPTAQPDLRNTVKTPTANMNSGTYHGAVVVNLNCDTSGATIYYTTDGSVPTINSNEYLGLPILFNQNGKFTLRAIAVKNGMKNSAELAVVYNIEDLNADNSSGDAADNEWSWDDDSDAADKQTNNKSSAKAVKVKKPGKVHSVKVKKKNAKKVTTKSRYTLSWKKVKGATGYEVQLYNYSAYRRTCTIKKKTIKTKKSSLKNRKLYWYIILPKTPEFVLTGKVRVRAYKKQKGKIVYGKYSGWKSIATKKQIKEFMKYN